MEKIDNLLKAEKLLNMIRESVEREIEDFKVLKEEELRELERKMEEEKKKEIERIEKWMRREVEKIEKFYDSKKTLFLSQERLRLKSELIEILRGKLKEILENLEGEEKEKFVLKLFEDAKGKVEGNFKVICRKGYAEVISKVFEGEVEESDDVDGVVLVSGRMRVVSNLESFLESLMDEVVKVVEEKVGDLR